jgi:hypothetical protein
MMAILGALHMWNKVDISACQEIAMYRTAYKNPLWRASFTRSKPSWSITGSMQYGKKQHVISLLTLKASTTVHRNTYLAMWLMRRGFAGWDAILRGTLDFVAPVR